MEARRSVLAQAAASRILSLDANYNKKAKQLVQEDDFEGAAALKREWQTNRDMESRRLHQLQSAEGIGAEAACLSTELDSISQQAVRVEKERHDYEQSLKNFLEREDFDSASSLKKQWQERLLELKGLRSTAPQQLAEEKKQYEKARNLLLSKEDFAGAADLKTRWDARRQTLEEISAASPTEKGIGAAYALACQESERAHKEELQML
eukprot:1610924-Karenia_brevis.AAC.1